MLQKKDINESMTSFPYWEKLKEVFDDETLEIVLNVA